MAGVTSYLSAIGVNVSQAAIDGFKIASEQISTKGKTEEEIQALITEWFGKATQAMVDAFGADSGISGLTMERLAMLAVNLEQVNGALDLVNVSLADISPAGALAAEALVNAMGGLEAFAAATNAYYQEFFTEEEKLANLTAQVQKVFAGLNQTMPTTRDGFRAIVESLDLMTEDGRDAYAQLMAVAGAFATITPAAEQMVDAVTQAFENLDTAFADFEKSINAQRQSSLDKIDELEKSKTAITDNLATLRDGVDTAFAGLQRWADVQTQSINDAADAEIAALGRVSDAVETNFDDVIKSLSDSMVPLEESISFLQDASQALRGALERMRPDSLEFDINARRGAQATLRGAVGGNLPSMDVLNAALSEVSNTSTDQFSSRNAYLRDFYQTQNLVEQLLSETEGQLSTEEQTLSGIKERISQAEKHHSEAVNTMNAQIEAINLARDKQLEGVKDQLKLAQDQIDALDGVDTNIYTLTDVTRAIQTYEQAKILADEQIAMIDQQIENEYTQIDYLDSLYETSLDQYETLKGIDRSVLSVADAVDRLYLAMAEAGTAVPGFAGGGFHRGGLRIVGERGPELEYTPPSQIFNAQDTQAIMNGGVTSELQSMRSYNEAAMKAIARNTSDIKKLRDIFDKWDNDGMPAERTA